MANIVINTKVEEIKLLDIIYNGDIQEIKKNKDNIIKYIANLHHCVDTAIINGNLPLVKLLFSWLPKTDSQIHMYMINTSLECCKYDITKFLLKEKSAELTPTDFQIYINNLMIDIFDNDTTHIDFNSTIDILLDFGADINYIKTEKINKDKGQFYMKYSSVFLGAIYRTDYNMIQHIIEHPKFDLTKHIKLDGGYTLIREILKKNFNPGYPLLNKVLSMRNILNIKKPLSGYPNLIMGSIRHRDAYSMTKKLLDAGVEIGNIEDQYSPLPLIAKSDDVALKQLIEQNIGCKCNPNLNAAEKRLFKAIKDKNLKDIKCEINANININVIKDPFKNRVTPLMYSFVMGASPEITKILLNAGADPNIKDIEGKTPFDMVAFYARNCPFNDSCLHNGIRVSMKEKFASDSEKKDYIINLFNNIKNNTSLLIASGSEISFVNNTIEDILESLTSSLWTNRSILVDSMETIYDSILETILIIKDSEIDVDYNTIFKQSLKNDFIYLAKKLLDADLDVDINRMYSARDHSDFNKTDYKTTLFIEMARSTYDKSTLHKLAFLINAGVDYDIKDTNGNNAEFYIKKIADRAHNEGLHSKYLEIINKKITSERLADNDVKMKVPTDYEYNL